jgi:hypothetical protein
MRTLIRMPRDINRAPGYRSIRQNVPHIDPAGSMTAASATAGPDHAAIGFAGYDFRIAKLTRCVLGRGIAPHHAS